jgi:hypothetical protein
VQFFSLSQFPAYLFSPSLQLTKKENALSFCHLPNTHPPTHSHAMRKTQSKRFMAKKFTEHRHNFSFTSPMHIANNNNQASQHAQECLCAKANIRSSQQKEMMLVAAEKK